MKCLNRIIAGTICLSLIACLSGCSKNKISVKYGEYNLPDNYNINSEYSDNTVTLFAEKLCAVDSDITQTSSIDTASIYAAGIFDVNENKTLYSYHSNEKVYPASLTKVMTALVVLDTCSLDEVVTIPDVTIYEDGVQLFGLKEGDQITVRDLLYINLVYSGNDAALALAKYVAGTEEAFVTLMNEKAVSLGATHSNYVNSHGLSNDNHYTTAYDLYLVFNAAIKYDEFINIINTQSYTVSYTNAAGEPVEKTINTTNKFLDGTYQMPDSSNVVGGKTGSTFAAGKCIILYAKNASGNPYICVMMGASDEQSLYTNMRNLITDAIN